MVDELVRTYSDWVMLIIRLYHGTQVIWNQKLKKKKILDFVENALVAIFLQTVGVAWQVAPIPKFVTQITLCNLRQIYSADSGGSLASWYQSKKN